MKFIWGYIEGYTHVILDNGTRHKIYKSTKGTYYIDCGKRKYLTLPDR